MLDHQREAVLGWFACHLKGEGAGNPIPERDGHILTVRELAFFRNGKARPAKVRTIDEHCRLQGAELGRSRKPGGARELAALLRLQPMAGRLKLHEFKAVDGIRRMALEAGEHLIPVLVADGKKSGRCKILLYPRGKEEVTETILREAQTDGSTVVMADLFGTGETGQPNYVLGEHHQLFRQLLWIGRTLPGEWVFDILALVKMARMHLGGKKIVVEGHREAGVCAIFAGAVAEDAFSVVAVDAPASYLYCDDSLKGYGARPFERYPEDRFYSAMLPVPGFLKWGDVSQAASLCGKVELVSPRKYDGTPQEGR
jgi:hypothetical protein